MRKGLLLAVAFTGAAFHRSLKPLAANAVSTSQQQRKYCAQQVVVLFLFFVALISMASTMTKAQSLAETRLRRLAPLRLSEVSEGTRVSITSDASLDDYTAYRNADRFHVLIPQAQAPATLNLARGRGFTDIQLERRGTDIDLSFVLRQGVTASVSQKFNRLDVTFNVPPELVASAATTVLEAAASSRLTSSEPTMKIIPVALGEKVSLPATPLPTPDPAATAPKEDPKPSPEKPSGTAKPGAIVLPPEKANPVHVNRLDKPPVIDGKLDDAVWQQATLFKDFYQFRPGDNIAPSKPTEALLGYDSKFLYIAFRAFDEPGKVRATVAKRDGIFDDDFIGVFLDTFNDRRRAYEFLFNPLGIQADAIYTESSGEDFSVDVVMESKGSITENGYVVEIAIPFKSLRYEVGKDKLWGVHFLRTIKRLDNEQDSWMPIARDNSSTLNQAGHITGFEGVSTEHTLEVIPSLTISETGKRVSSFAPLPPGVVDPGRMLNEPVHVDPGVTLKYGITPTITLDLALNPDFAQVEADQTVVTANQRFPIFFEEKRPFFLEGIDIFQTPLTVVHTRAIIDPDIAVKLSGKRGRNTFGLMMASDNGPGSFTGDDRLDARNIRFLDKNAFVGVLRLKRDIGKENSIGLIATDYNFIEKENQVLGFDGRFRFDKKTVATFQVAGTSSRRFFFNPDEGQSALRRGNAFAYSARYEVNGRNWNWNYDGRGFTKDYRADVGFTRRPNNNRHGLFLAYNTDSKTKGTLLRQHYHILPEIQFDWQGRIQSWGQEFQTELGFKNQTYVGLGVSLNYERIFEEEFGATRNAPASRCFSSSQLQLNPALHCGFAGDDSERSTRRNNIYGYAGTTPSKKYSLNMFMIYNWGAFDFDFGAGPNFPRVSPAALLGPDNAPQDPGKGNNFHFDGGIAYQPTNELRLSLDYTKDRLVRSDTGRVAFDENIFALRGTYQFTRFTFARARIDYDTLAERVRGQFLLGWAPNPGTSFYVGYNDDLNLNGYGPISGRLEPGFRRNGRTFFIKMSYLFRRSF